MVWHTTFDLDMPQQRPCLMVILQRGHGKRLLVIVAHMPHLNKRTDLTRVMRGISSHLPDPKQYDDVIMLGDMNDHNTVIHAAAPVRIGDYHISQGLSRSRIQKELVTCCWHRKGHPTWPSMSETGDYILAQRVLNTRIPPVFESTRGKPVASDHLPVEAWVQL